MHSSTRRLAAFLIAAVGTGLLVSVIQTQIVLAALIDLGVPVTVTVRALTTLQDMAQFGPVMIGIAVAVLLPAFLLAHQILRIAPATWRSAVFVISAVAGLWLAFWLMRTVIPMPAIPGTRSPLGHALMVLPGIAGGLLYARRTSASVQLRTAAQHAVTAAVLVLVPATLFIVMAPGAGTQPDPVAPDSYVVQPIKTGLNRPWSVAFLPDGRTLVTEMGGRLLAIAADGASSDIALNALPPLFQQGGVSGLMDVVLDPQFAQNGWIYLTMGYGSLGANGTRLVRGRLVDDRLDDVRVLFSSTPKPSAGNNGGRLAFLGDGTLVLSVGDGSTRREEAQNAANHLGTVVRLDREGQPPADNPFVQQTGAAPEIYSFGHRNAQGIAVDPATGELLLSEHGARGGDEINRIVPGGNYGWPVVTGGIDYPFARVSPFRQLAGYEDTMVEWTPAIAPAGLAVYDGALFPAWRGDLLVPALKERSVRRVIRDGQNIVGQQLLLADRNERMRDVKVAPDGSIYVLTDGVDAKLLRLTPPEQRPTTKN